MTMPEVHIRVEITDQFLGGAMTSADDTITATALAEGVLPPREIVRRRLHTLVDQLVDDDCDHIPGGQK